MVSLKMKIFNVDLSALNGFLAGEQVLSERERTVSSG
jgi:hypothetical protein